MAQIQKKFIAANSIDGTKVQFANAQSFVALNSSASPANLFNFSAANNLQFQQQVDANSNAIINLPTPTNPGDAVNKSYADALISGFDWKNPVIAATTGALPTYTYLSGVITETGNGVLPDQDGITLSAGQRLLVKDETSGNAPYNGIYVVTQSGDGSTPFILTRSSDANTAESLQYAAMLVASGDSQTGFQYFETAAITTLGVDDVSFVQVNSGMSYTFGDGLELDGSTVSVIAADTSILVASGGVSVALNTDGGLNTTSGLRVVNSNSAIAISSSGVGVALNSASGLQISSGLAVLASDTSLTVASGGTSVHLNSASGLQVSSGLGVLASDTSITVASGGISAHLNTAGALQTSSGLSVKVDSSTVKINGSNNLQAVTQQVDNLTLNGTDITNQYKDLTYPITGTSSVWLSVIGGIIQQNGTDYTVSATGGSGGVGRITFAGGLATSGASQLISGDILVIGYEHF